MIGSVSKDATKPVITGDGVVDDKKNVKTVEIESLKQEKALNSGKSVKIK